MPSIAFQKNKKYALFLFFASLLGFSLVLYIRAKYGAAVSGDGVIYLSVANNLVEGKGFFDHLNMPLIWFPPLYPIILAGLKKVTGADILVVGTFFQAFILGINIALTGIILQLSLKNNSIWKYLGILFILTSDSYLNLHAGIITEPLFITLSLFFILAVGSYLKDVKKNALLIMIITAALASLLRWVGLSLVMLGGFFIFWKYFVLRVVKFEEGEILEKNDKRVEISLFFKDATIFGFFSVSPLIAWSLGHNYAKYGTLWGAAGIASVPALNLKLSLIKILHWFLPLYPAENPFIGHPYIIIVAILLGLLTLNKKENWIAFLRKSTNPFIFASFLFGIIYLGALVFTVSTYDHIQISSTRYYPILMLSVLLFIFTAIDNLVLPHILKKGKIWINIATLFLILWFAYPFASTYKYVQIAKDAEFSWGAKASPELNWNTSTYHNSSVVEELKKITHKDDLPVYSNYTDVVWLYTRTNVNMLPTMAPDVSEEEMIEKYQIWHKENAGYIIWFTPNAYDHIVPVEILAKITNLELIMRDDVGVLYRVYSKEE